MSRIHLPKSGGHGPWVGQAVRLSNEPGVVRFDQGMGVEASLADKSTAS